MGGNVIIRGVDLPTKARQALAAHDWAAAFDVLTALTARSAPSAEDLDALAQAAWWIGRLDVSIDAHERAHQEFVASDRTDGAVMSAIYLSYDYFNKGDFALGAAWHARGARLVQQIPNSPAAGYFGIIECGAAYRAGDLAGCLDRANLVAQIGEDHRDATLIAWAIHWQGLALIRQGHVDQGWRLLDEDILEVSLRQMQPLWAGFLYCDTIQICDELGDPRRGWQWIEITERWLTDLSSGSVYPGICRMYKANIMRERGIWLEAEREARRVCEELATLHISTAARAHYELGEIKRLTGDIEAAEAFFMQAHRMGFDPQPGLARLRLGRGDVDAALGQLQRAVDEARDGLARARFLPDLVEIALVRGDHELARSAAEELDAVATTYRSPGLTASAMSARGDVLLADPDAASALAAFRQAARLWNELDCPYRAARCRSRAGEAYRALGDEEGARMELEAARDVFEQLGADPDAQRCAELLGRRTHPAGLSDREVDVLRLVAAGRSNKGIAAELFISEHTAARHMSNIFAKLAVSSRAAATAYALRHGIA
jgi:DNA-binding CsgD family transcriptional regulator/tetratricopeptide (TPR) repeat protein